ncbi:MAG: flagellar protein FlaG [Halanaerobiales bacterium]|nr:flagellar protein FlaG [Halanaerobiales bacterium]
MNIKNVQVNSILTNLKNHEMIKSEKIKDANETAEINNEIHKKNDNIEQTKNTLQGSESKKSILEITNELNEMVKTFNRKLEFSVHEDTNRVMVKVVDTETDEIIREIPPEAVLDIVAKMQDTFSIFVDVRV